MGGFLADNGEARFDPRQPLVECLLGLPVGDCHEVILRLLGDLVPGEVAETREDDRFADLAQQRVDARIERGSRACCHER